MKKRVSVTVFIKAAIIICLAAACIALTAVPVGALRSTCKESRCEYGAVCGSDYCSYHKCGVDGCTKKVSRNGYCSSHQTKKSREDAEETTYKTCAVNGCTKRTEKDSMFCKKHTCTKKKCQEQKMSRALYCKEHLKRRCRTATITTALMILWTTGTDICRTAATRRTTGRIGKDGTVSASVIYFR